MEQAEAKRRSETMEGAAVARNIWSLHDATKETRERCVAAEQAVIELKAQVTMLRQELDTVRAVAHAAMGMAQGGRSTA